MAGLKRDAMAEVSEADRERIGKRSVVYEGVKQAAEFYGCRTRRFVLHDSASEVSSSSSNKVKLIHFVRHGEGFHNIWRKEEFAAGRVPYAKRHNRDQVLPDLHDPHLTDVGREEARMAQAAVEHRSPELLVSSPIRRALETLFIVFSKAIDSGVPVLAHELCREAFFGKDPSIYDSRLDRASLEKEFPAVNFEHVLPSEQLGSETLDDPLWFLSASPYGHCEDGLSEAAHAEHAFRFMTWVFRRTEREIGIATHSLFLLALWHGVFEFPQGRPKTTQLFHTGECRSVWVEEVQVSLPPAVSRWTCTMRSDETPLGSSDVAS
mmetsp:Transcript_31657/g.73928  ORF Transcript_31657/g.73928 Transcript_31657/m.73928 type:complete len:322 (+) Transcript_31657:61-1026(+)